MKTKSQSCLSAPISILLIENNKHERAAFEGALRKSESAFRIAVCEKAEEVLDKLPAGRDAFDVVVVDNDLPGMTGMDFYRRLRIEF